MHLRILIANLTIDSIRGSCMVVFNSTLSFSFSFFLKKREHRTIWCMHPCPSISPLKFENPAGQAAFQCHFGRPLFLSLYNNAYYIYVCPNIYMRVNTCCMFYL